MSTSCRNLLVHFLALQISKDIGQIRQCLAWNSEGSKLYELNVWVVTFARLAGLAKE